jgi:hypothetical protein
MTFSAKHQQGLTFITILLILGIVAFFVLLGLKIGPIYINHSRVTNALSAVEELEDIETLSKPKIYSLLEKRFGLNYVEYVVKDDVKIVKQGNYLKVEIEYERVVPIVGNLSVLVEFYDYFEVGGNE